MFERFFLAHPRSVEESYLEHMRSALSFARLFLFAGFAALIHAIFPTLFETTGSRIVARLHDRMVLNRRRPAPGDIRDSRALVE